jgi:hypothetical protein
MAQKPPKRNRYAGPTTCLRCDQLFESWDRRQNRLCDSCRQVLKDLPSEEPLRPEPPRRSIPRED